MKRNSTFSIKILLSLCCVLFYIILSHKSFLSITGDLPTYKNTLVSIDNKYLSDFEYFPGSIYYFYVVKFLSSFYSTDTFLNGVVIVNTVTLVLYGFYIYKTGNLWSQLIVLVAFGPVILFRFDTIVVLLTLVFINKFNQKKFPLSALALGLGFITKLYPVIYIPLTCLNLISKKNSFLTFFGTLMLTVILMIWSLSLITHISIGELLLTPMKFQSTKPMSVDSLWGSSHSLTNKILKNPLQLKEYGIYGFLPEENELMFPLFFYNYFWIIPVIVVTLYLNKRRSKLSVESIILITMTYLLVSKLLAAQYFYWFILLLPLSKTFFNLKTTLILVIIGFLTQLIYPIYFLEFLQSFITQQLTSLDIILLARQLLFFALYVYFFFLLQKEHAITRSD